MKIYYSDVDDTIVSNDKISDEMEGFLPKVKNYFVPCSGRPLVSMKKMFENLNIKYLIGFNGGQIYDVEKDEFLLNKLIEKEEVYAVVDLLKSIDVEFLIYLKEDVYASDINNKYAKVEEEICNLKLKKMEKIDSSPKILGLCNPEYIDEKITVLKESFPQLEIVKSKPFFIEISPKGSTKGEAIKKLNNHLGISPEDTYCFGDSDNDISMFELNVNKIAVGNANDNIKKRANKIIDTCENDGVLKFLKEIENEIV